MFSGFGGSSFRLHFDIGSSFGWGSFCGFIFDHNGLRLGGVEDSGAAGLAFVKGLLDLRVSVSRLVPFVFLGEVGVDLCQVLGTEIELVMDRLHLLVSKVRNIGRGKLGFDVNPHGSKGLVLIGKGLIESESPEARLSSRLVVSELVLIFSIGSCLSGFVNPFNTDSDFSKQFVAFGGLHVVPELTVLLKFGLHLVSVALELVSDALPVKELHVFLVEGQFLLTEGFLLLRRDSMRRSIKLDSGVGSAGALFSLILLLTGGSIFVHCGSTNGHLLHLSPGFSKLSVL